MELLRLSHSSAHGPEARAGGEWPSACSCLGDRVSEPEERHVLGSGDLGSVMVRPGSGHFLSLGFRPLLYTEGLGRMT